MNRWDHSVTNELCHFADHSFESVEVGIEVLNA